MNYDYDSRMNDTEFLRVMAKIKSVIGKSCPSCGGIGFEQLSRFLIADVVYDNSPNRNNSEGAHLGPNVKLVCGNCGGIRYFDADISGLCGNSLT